jgi:ABC-2 type transport system permease protein
MDTVMYAQFLKDKRKPLLILLFIGLSILATLIFSNPSTKTSVFIFATGPNAEETERKWEALLNEQSETDYIIAKEEEARKQVKEGKGEVAIHVMENDYRLITASNMPNILLVEQHVQQVFTKEAKLQAVAGNRELSEVREEVEDYLESPPLKITTKDIDGKSLGNHDMGIQLLFGFTLFVAMFTIGFKVNGITNDKVNGVWNRLILSPVSKTGMYSGHLLYSFFVGLFQVTIVFLIFRYMMGFDLGNLAMILVIGAVYVFSTVSFAMLIAGVTGTPEKFNMIYMSVIPIIPVTSGVYMMPGTLDIPIFETLSSLFPLSYGVDAMLDVALYEAGWSDILLPIAFMLLLAVLYMGIGINLVERKKG